MTERDPLCVAGEFDARKWAVAFMKAHVGRTLDPMDIDTMQGWFAGAIMAGYDTRAKEELDEEPSPPGVDAFRERLRERHERERELFERLRKSEEAERPPMPLAELRRELVDEYRRYAFQIPEPLRDPRQEAADALDDYLREVEGEGEPEPEGEDSHDDLCLPSAARATRAYWG